MGGYEHFLEAWHDETHEEHEAMREWDESQHYSVHLVKLSKER